MKTSTVNGVTYELPDGWEPIETVPTGVLINIKHLTGRVTYVAVAETPMVNTNFIAWQHIVAPKVMPWKPKVGSDYWFINSQGTADSDRWLDYDIDESRYEVCNVYPTQAAAEAARERVIAAHNGGAKWKGGVRWLTRLPH